MGTGEGTGGSTGGWAVAASGAGCRPSAAGFPSLRRRPEGVAGVAPAGTGGVAGAGSGAAGVGTAEVGLAGVGTADAGFAVADWTKGTP
uniref:hypothetical protein n=1 Tax=Streptomyces fradiae TaxID=1906 RepID=UPI003F8E067B